MGKSKKRQFSLELTENEINNKSSIKENNLQGLKNKKNKTRLVDEAKEDPKEFVNLHDVTQPIKKKKKKKSLFENRGMETENIELEALMNETEKTPASQILESKKKVKKKSKSEKRKEKAVPSTLPKEISTETTKKKKEIDSPIENEETGESLVSQKKSKKKKRKLADKLESQSPEESTELNVEIKKKKKKHTEEEHQDNVEETVCSSKPKKSISKIPNFKKENVALEKGESDLKSKQKLKKKKSKNEIKNRDDSLVDDSSHDDKDGRNSRTIFIGNVPVKYNKKKFLKLLKQKGEVEKCWTRGFIPQSDKISKKTAAIANLLSKDQPPLFVYVLYKTAADASNALSLNGVIFDDHRLRVTHSSTKLYSPLNGVFVGNLPLNVTDDDVYDMFRKCGEIVSTRVVRTNNGVGRGIAFVNFSSSDAVELALKLNEEKLRDREMRVLRLKSQMQMKKIQKRKAQRAAKDSLLDKKSKKKNGESYSDKSSDKFQKKKKLNSVEFKKKILAKKLTGTTKRKEKKFE